MSTFTVNDLAEIIRDGAGEVEPIDWNGGAERATFDDLGYDSIALLEIAGLVRQQFGVAVEDELDELRTPGEFVARVNELTAAR